MMTSYLKLYEGWVWPIKLGWHSSFHLWTGVSGQIRFPQQLRISMCYFFHRLTWRPDTCGAPLSRLPVCLYVRHRCHLTKSPLFPIYTGIQALYWPNTIYKGIKALFWVTHSILGLVLVTALNHLNFKTGGPLRLTYVFQLTVEAALFWHIACHDI